ncbi:MAG: preprotein translocase subunit SecY [Actinobacteria bacterium RBG_16_64_13]|nr:MAG: preprotein translocase subunit SecY [Actinobacteria bacterium RBG_16_64_13]
MFQSLLNAWRLPDLRKKLLFTAMIIAIYRLGCYIPVPGVSVSSIKEMFNTGGVFDFYDLFSGGGLQRVAIFAMGIMPYITASIIMQLLTMVSPRLEALMKEGPAGQKKVNQYTRYFTVVLALIEAVGFVFLFQKYGAFPPEAPLTALRFFLIVLTLTVGTALVMWLGELITQRGIGNGISLMIFTSIVSRLPSGLQMLFTMNPAYWVAMGVIALLVVAAVIFVTQGQRRIPVQYAKRVVGRKVYGGQSTYLPLRVNMAGVIPVIFASSVLLFPVTLAQMVPWGWTQKLAEWVGPNTWWYVAVEVILIVLFTYFYTAVQFNPIDQADNLKKYGGFVPGIRPGRPTAAYLDRVLTRITFPGALFLAAIVLLPTALIKGMSVPFYFGGTSILIVVGVALDTMQQMESQLLMRHYEGFLK